MTQSNNESDRSGAVESLIIPANLVLADELGREMPPTLAATLAFLQEGSVPLQEQLAQMEGMGNGDPLSLPQAEPTAGVSFHPQPFDDSSED